MGVESKIDRLSDKFDLFRRWLIGTVLLSFLLCLFGQAIIFYMLHEKINHVENKVIILWEERQKTITQNSIPKKIN